jgi:hypothetical protein
VETHWKFKVGLGHWFKKYINSGLSLGFKNLIAIFCSILRETLVATYSLSSKFRICQKFHITQAKITKFISLG